MDRDWERWSAETRNLIGSDPGLVYSAERPVSVVLTCRNRANLLPLVLRRLAKQTRSPDRVILADDCSDDGSVDVFRSLCTEQRLSGEVVSLPPGPAYRINTVRNQGVTAAPDGLVILLDSDLGVGPSFIEAHCRMHQSGQAPCCSFGPLLESARPDGSGPVHFKWGMESITLISPSPAAPLPSWATLLGGNMGMPRRLWEIVGRFDERFNGSYGADDQDFHYRLFLAGATFLGEFEAYAVHYPHDAFVPPRPEINLRRFREKYGFGIYDEGVIPQHLFQLAWRDGPWHRVAARLGRGDPDAVLTLGSEASYRRRPAVRAWGRLLRMAASLRLLMGVRNGPSPSP